MVKKGGKQSADCFPLCDMPKDCFDFVPDECEEQTASNAENDIEVFHPVKGMVFVPAGILVELLIVEILVDNGDFGEDIAEYHEKEKVMEHDRVGMVGDEVDKPAVSADRRLTGRRLTSGSKPFGNTQPESNACYGGEERENRYIGEETAHFVKVLAFEIIFGQDYQNDIDEYTQK